MDVDKRHAGPIKMAVPYFLAVMLWVSLSWEYGATCLLRWVRACRPKDKGHRRRIIPNR
jgi:hypothetical protein